MLVINWNERFFLSYKIQLNSPIFMADSLMYYHVYADLFMMSKSKELGLSVYSMNQHYLELQLYLSEIAKDS